MEYINKIVDFGLYCPKCKHQDIAEAEHPCHDCLNNPTNVHSRKPVHFEEKPKKKKLNNKK